MCSGPFPFASQYCAEPRMLTMRQNKNKIQTNCAWNGYRTHAWLREFIGSRVAPAAWIDIYTWVIWNLPKNRGRKLNYPKQQQQRDGYRSENKTIKGTQNKKEEKKKRIKVEGRIKKNGKSNENQQAQRASLQLTVISSTLLAQPYTTLPCPAQPPRCHINHISHATLCPLMSMPDICHGPWPMSYYLHNNTACLTLPCPVSGSYNNRTGRLFISPTLPHCCLSQRRSSASK